MYRIRMTKAYDSPVRALDEGRVIVVGVELSEVDATALVYDGYAERVTDEVQTPESAEAKTERKPRTTRQPKGGK